MHLNVVQIAESFGVSESIVEGWVRNEGMPHTPDRGRMLFDREQVAEWSAKRGLAAKAGFLGGESPTLRTGLRIAPLLRAGGIWRDVPASGVPGVFARILTSLPGTTPPVRQLLSRRVCDEGGVTFAPVGGGFALPHPANRIALGRDSGVVALLLLRDPLSLHDPAPDGAPVTRLLFFVAPSPRLHLDLLARLSRGLSLAPLRESLVAGASDDVILHQFEAADSAFSNEKGKAADA